MPNEDVSFLSPYDLFEIEQKKPQPRFSNLIELLEIFKDITPIDIGEVLQIAQTAAQHGMIELTPVASSFLLNRAPLKIEGEIIEDAFCYGMGLFTRVEQGRANQQIIKSFQDELPDNWKPLFAQWKTNKEARHNESITTSSQNESIDETGTILRDGDDSKAKLDEIYNLLVNLNSTNEVERGENAGTSSSIPLAQQKGPNLAEDEIKNRILEIVDLMKMEETDTSHIQQSVKKFNQWMKQVRKDQRRFPKMFFKYGYSELDQDQFPYPRISELTGITENTLKTGKKRSSPNS